jgi:fibronectin type 3 domain-containing protein
VTWSDNSTASLDAGATADTHTILANVDDVNRIAESNTPTHNTRVTLNWDQSPSPNITQNKIYRSTTGSGGPYLLLATISATTSYIDPGLTSGLEYFYVVTAVNSSGQESGISNYTSATPR